MDKYGRITIPKEFRDLVKLDSEEVAICLDDDFEFHFVSTDCIDDDDMVIAIAPMDEKGRIYLPTKMLQRYHIKETEQNEFFFIEKRKIHVLFEE